MDGLKFCCGLFLCITLLVGPSHAQELKKVVLSSNKTLNKPHPAKVLTPLTPKSNVSVSPKASASQPDLSMSPTPAVMDHPEEKVDPMMSRMPKVLGYTDILPGYPLLNDEDIQVLDTLYRKGQAKEAHSIYITAVDNYNELIRYGVNLLANKNKKFSEAKIHNILPYVISGTYRMAIVTNKAIKSNMLNLYDQLEMYKNANDQLNTTISLIAEYKFEKKIRLAKATYGVLYYARGYNKIALARTLLLGNVWKKYTVYMPSDIVSLVASAISDLNVMLDFSSLTKDALLVVNGLPLNTTGDWDVLLDNFLTKYLIFMSGQPCESKTLQLCYYTGDRTMMRDMIRKRILNSIYPVVDYYNAPDVQKTLFSASEIKGIDDVAAIPPDLFNVILKIFELIQKA